MYQIEYSKLSIRVLRRMSANIAAAIRDKIGMLAQDPFSAPGVKKLKSREGYRLRVGDWRVLYLLDDRRLVVLVMDIGSRGGIYQ
jgi:mRNA interferase RelE/StbE